nr:hypothetical protein [Tanacetum cinerariifolium]
MAQQVIPAAQLVPRFHTIGRCNNYTVLQSIPCSPECKIVGQIILDHPLSYALTVTANVLVVYLQLFWRTVSKLHAPEHTIRFMLNTQEFIYTVDMFQDILYLPVETPENPFEAPVNIKTIEAFINRVGYQGVIDKVSAFYTKNLAQPWKTMFKTVLKGLKRIIILSRMIFHWSTPRAHRTPTLTASPQGKKRKQNVRESSSPNKSLKITIRQQKVVEGNKDDDDSQDRLEPKSHKDKPEHVDNDDDKGLIYLNSKDEKWVMYLTDIVKFWDATLEKVLKERNNQATKSPRANEKMGIFCEWKTNSIDDEASIIINP